MNIHPVKTEEDYEAALGRIEELWGADPGTPQGNELDVLLILVGVYEDANHPVPPPSPIEAIKFVMEQKGLKQADLIPYFGTRSRVSEVLSGKRGLSLSMIRALHAALKIPAKILIQDGLSLPPGGEGVLWDRFPVQEIVKNGLVEGYDPKAQAEEIIRDLVDQTNISKPSFTPCEKVYARQGGRRNQKDNPYSVQAWLWAVMAAAQKIELKAKFDQESLDIKFISKVVQLSVFDKGPKLAAELLGNVGIKLVILPHLKKTYLDGAALLAEDGKPVIALSLRYDRIDNFWFTLSHELAHLVLGHVHEVDGQYIIDDLDLKASTDHMEQEADDVAEEALIPEALWSTHDAPRTLKSRDVDDLANKANLHSAIVAGRIRYEEKNYRLLHNKVGQGEVRQLFA